MSNTYPSKLGKRARCIAILALLAGSVTALGGAGAARADGAADEADLHFQLGAVAYSKGDYTTALQHFLQSNRLVPNKNVVFNIARAYEELKRFADAYRYYADSLEGETNTQLVTEIEGALKRIAPNVAVLKVQTDPPNAAVFLDRKDLGSRGRAPRPLALAEGKYKVIVELDGYEPAEQDGVDVKTGVEKKVSFALKRIVGTVKVQVTGAPDAVVHVDDESAPAACTAPCSFETPPGRHVLFFTREGFQSVPQPVNVVAKETATSTAVLAPLTGAVVVSADERDAVVEIDGKPAGFTPAVIQNVAVGKRAVKVTLRGYAPVERIIDVKANQQSQLTDLKLEPLRQVAAASRFTQNIEDAPSSVTVIDGQELRAFGYPTIAESLRGVRGVYLSNDRAYVSAGIRGLGEPNDYGNRLLVLSDGANLNDNLLNSSYIGSDGRDDLGDVERIEVVRGPGSLLYGTGAMSGVVNLVPRAKDAPSGAHASVGVYDNAVAHARAGVHYNFLPDGQAGFWASVTGSRSDGVDVATDLKDSTFGPSPVTIHKVDWHRGFGTAGRAWYKALTAQWFFHSREQHIPVGAYSTYPNDPRTSFTDQRFLGEIRFEPQINQKLQLFTRAHFNYYRFGGDYSYAPPPAAVTHEDYYGMWAGGEARLVWSPFDTMRITVGGEAQFHPEATMLGGFSSDPALNAPYLDSHEPYNFGAPYGVIDWAITPWLRFSGGGRADIYGKPVNDAIPVFRAAVILKPPTGTVLKLMGGRAFRAPSVYEQFYNDGGVSQIPAVDATHKLGPEDILTGEVELSQRFLEDWTVLGSGHVSRIENIINTVEVDPTSGAPSPGSGIVRYANSSVPALTIGGDLEIRRDWRQGWMLSAMVGYQRAAYTADPPETTANVVDKRRLINAPEILASFKGVVPVVQDLASIGLRLTLDGPRRISLSSDEVTQTTVVGDVTVSGDIKRFGVGYVIGVYNVLDLKYSQPVLEIDQRRGSPQNGRTFLAQVRVDYP